MEYHDVDEITKQAACENVKKIVDAIKLIRIKYYPNFASISEEDQRIFQELSFDLERIASENNLHSLKDTLMKEVSAKYEEQEREVVSTDDILLACYGAIDVEQKALSEGKIKQALRCQKILEEYFDKIESENYKKLVIDYKREKLGELIRQKDVPAEIRRWSNLLEGYCKAEDASARNAVADLISNMATKEKDIQQEDVKTDEEIVIG